MAVTEIRAEKSWQLMHSMKLDLQYGWALTRLSSTFTTSVFHVLSIIAPSSSEYLLHPELRRPQARSPETACCQRAAGLYGVCTCD